MTLVLLVAVAIIAFSLGVDNERNIHCDGYECPTYAVLESNDVCFSLLLNFIVQPIFLS